MRRLLLCLMMAGLAFAAAKPAPLTMTLNPRTSFALSKPTIRITLHIERATNNRALGWVCDGDTGNYYSRTWTLDGDQTPTNFEDSLTMRQVAGGHYECAAVLSRGDETFRARGSFDVVADEAR